MSTRVDALDVTVVGLAPSDPRHVERSADARALLRELTSAQILVEAQSMAFGIGAGHWLRVHAAIAPSLSILYVVPYDPLVSGARPRAATLWRERPVELLHDNQQSLVLCTTSTGDLVQLRRDPRPSAPTSAPMRSSCCPNPRSYGIPRTCYTHGFPLDGSDHPRTCAEGRRRAGR